MKNAQLKLDAYAIVIGTVASFKIEIAVFNFDFLNLRHDLLNASRALQRCTQIVQPEME